MRKKSTVYWVFKSVLVFRFYKPEESRFCEKLMPDLLDAAVIANDQITERVARELLVELLFQAFGNWLR